MKQTTRETGKMKAADLAQRALQVVAYNGEFRDEMCQQLAKLLKEGDNSAQSLAGKPSFEGLLAFCLWSRRCWDWLHHAALGPPAGPLEKYHDQFVRIMDKVLTRTSNLEKWNFRSLKDRNRAQQYCENMQFRRKLVKKLQESGIDLVYIGLLQQALKLKDEPKSEMEVPRTLVQSFGFEQEPQSEAQAELVNHALTLLTHKLLFITVELSHERGPYDEGMREHSVLVERALRRVEAIKQSAGLFQGQTTKLVSRVWAELADDLLPRFEEQLIKPLRRGVAQLSEDGKRAHLDQETSAQQVLDDVKKSAERLYDESIDLWRQMPPLESARRRRAYYLSGLSVAADSEVQENFLPTERLVNFISADARDTHREKSLDILKELSRRTDGSWQEITRAEIGERVEGLLASLAYRAAAQSRSHVIISEDGRLTPEICDELIFRLGLDPYGLRPVLHLLHEELVQFIQHRAYERSWGKLVLSRSGLRLLVHPTRAAEAIDLQNGNWHIAE